MAHIALTALVQDTSQVRADGHATMTARVARWANRAATPSRPDEGEGPVVIFPLLRTDVPCAIRDGHPNRAAKAVTA